MELKPGYKQTEVGVIPEDWEVVSVGSLGSGQTPAIKAGPFGSALTKDIYVSTGYKVYGQEQVIRGDYQYGDYFITFDKYRSLESCSVKPGDILLSLVGTVGKLLEIPVEAPPGIINPRLVRFSFDKKRVFPKFFTQMFGSSVVQSALKGMAQGGTMGVLNASIIQTFMIQLPPLPEQKAIAQALSDMDALISGLDDLIAKKRDIKQATMQQLLTGKTRLPGFSGDWEVKRLGDVADCLDNLRIPLNEAQRQSMKGDYPYCGANGVLGFVDRYVIDDDIILMAEDGGYFDEYETRPIAYRMVGKCWVNNHAHILKARPGFDQGFIFYSIVHKNILPFLASGTRAKLNKSEMYKIKLVAPVSPIEQQAIATVLSDIDDELTALDQRREKTRELKQAMMQELLTGRTRLV